MSIRTNTNPIPLALPPEMQDILRRNGMRAQLMGSSNGFQLVVQGHDSPVLSYPITERQLQALTDWGTNTANKRCYNTFASIVAADFDMPKDFVHARNANGRVAMGLHGYRVGVGEYGRMPRPTVREMMWGHGFLGWTPRQQGGFHTRRINGDLYFPAGAPIIPNRPDGRFKPGELQSGGYGFYYKGGQQWQQPQLQQDVLANLRTVIQPLPIVKRSTEPAKPYKELITSDVYFSSEKWLEVLASHGIVVNADQKNITIQSSAVDANLQYDLSDEQLAALTSNSIKDYPVDKRLEVLNEIFGDDFSTAITMDMLNSDKQIAIALKPEAQQELMSQQHQHEQMQMQAQMQMQQQYMVPREQLPEGVVAMQGDIENVRDNRGFFREGRHGREVTVDEIRVEPITEEELAQRKAEAEANGEKYDSKATFRMTAIIDGKVVSHDITQKQYDKFLALDDYHRMKLFAKIFPEVDVKRSKGDGGYRTSDGVSFGTKLTAALMAGGALLHGVGHVMHESHSPEVYAGRYGSPPPRPYFKPGVDTPHDVAVRNFEAAANTDMMHHQLRR